MEFSYAQLAVKVFIMWPMINLGLVEPLQWYRFAKLRLLNISRFQQLVYVPERRYRDGGFPGDRDIGEVRVFLWLLCMYLSIYVFVFC